MGLDLVRDLADRFLTGLRLPFVGDLVGDFAGDALVGDFDVAYPLLDFADLESLHFCLCAPFSTGDNGGVAPLRTRLSWTGDKMGRFWRAFESCIGGGMQSEGGKQCPLVVETTPDP